MSEADYEVVVKPFSFLEPLRDAIGLVCSERNRWERHEDSRTFLHWRDVAVKLNALYLWFETGTAPNTTQSSADSAGWQSIKTDPVTYLPRVLTGRLSDGAERGHGRLFHAVPNGDSWGKAACGAKPGRRSGSGFVASDNPHQTITCERCRKRLHLEGQ